MEDDRFEDATGDRTTAEICEDGEYVLVTVGRASREETIALTADDARRMAEVLLTYAESV